MYLTSRMIVTQGRKNALLRAAQEAERERKRLLATKVAKATNTVFHDLVTYMLFLLFTIFLSLRLDGVVKWSWHEVAIPLYIALGVPSCHCSHISIHFSPSSKFTLSLSLSLHISHADMSTDSNYSVPLRLLHRAAHAGTRASHSRLYFHFLNLTCVSLCKLKRGPPRLFRCFATCGHDAL